MNKIVAGIVGPPTLLLSFILAAGQSVADSYFIDKPSIACRAHLQIAFADRIQPAGDGFIFSFERGGKGVQMESYSDYDLHALVQGKARSALLTKGEDSSDIVFAIPDPDLPCRARALTQLPAVTQVAAAQPGQQPVQPAQPVIQQPVQPVQQQAALQQPVQPVRQPVIQQPVQQPVQPVQQPSGQLVQASASSVTAEIDATVRARLATIASPAEAQAYLSEVQGRITMFLAISQVVQAKPLTRRDRVLRVVDGEIARLQAEKNFLQQQLSAKFSTPIRPANANLAVSAFRAADTFPKIPYYVPGTNEFGEMLVVPRVSDVGTLQYDFDFIDPVANYAKVRDRIEVAHEDIDGLIQGLDKVDEWTAVAQENNINRRIEKTASCIPDGQCAVKKPGVASTEVIFQIYEDGSTAGRIQRNKGLFVAGYNMSVESSILLSAYLIYMKEVGAKEFQIGVMSDDQVKNLFQ